MTVVAGDAFTSESLANMRAVVPFCLIALLLSSLYFAFVGSKIRFLNEAYAASAQQNLLRFEKVELEFEKAKKFKDAGLSLPAEGSKASGQFEKAVPCLTVPKKD
jgi:hypothetical protein